jgi:hypothetical protein
MLHQSGFIIQKYTSQEIYSDQTVPILLKKRMKEKIASSFFKIRFTRYLTYPNG